jgi:4-carboxymuconolactone decarboxylase
MSSSEDVAYADRDLRLASARANYHEVMTSPGPDPVKPYYEGGVVGFVFGEMWPRPGLSRRDRRWITLACVGAMGAISPIETHIFAALNSGDCTLEELEEFNLFFAAQCGWPRGQVVDRYIEAAVQKLGLERGSFERWAEPMESNGRLKKGRAAYEEIMCVPPPDTDTVFRRVGYFDYLYGEIWQRPVLTRRERRLIALSCAPVVVTEAGAHAYAALKSSDLSFEELQELVLHVAVYVGWQNGALLDGIVVDAMKRTAE